MPKKPNPKWDDPAESERFLDAAKTAEAHENAEAFVKALKKVANSKTRIKPSD